MSTHAPATDAPSRAHAPAAQHDFEQYRKELTGYCYRMLGSGFEAEDAVQETMVRAWRNIDKFEGRSALRSWMYRIATNVCVDMLRGPQRRARPMDLGPASAADSALGAGLSEDTWITPIADAKVVPTDGDPAAIAAARDSIRLAFITALQHLPPRQRAVLILREVLSWHAEEVAELLSTSVASVNSALQRARATLSVGGFESANLNTIDARQQALLAKYMDAFERYDIDELVTLLHDDAVMSMPPFALWLQGSDEIGKFFLGTGKHCRGSRVIATEANGFPAIATYHRDPDGGYSPWSIQVIEITGERITALNSFLDTNLFEAFGLPTRLPAA
jgi:RNA polymerase sigma-70 factor (ECF subfamily)